MQSMSVPRRVIAMVLAAMLLMPLVASAGAGSPFADVVRNAACKANPVKDADGNETATGVDCEERGALGGFIDAADALASPIVVVMIAITPFACLYGFGSMMFGGRGAGRGLATVGWAAGALVGAVSMKGIVA